MSGLRTQLPTKRNMGIHQTQRDRTLVLLESHGIMRLTELKAHGIHPPTLTRLVDEGVIVRSSRGVYQRADASVDWLMTWPGWRSGFPRE